MSIFDDELLASFGDDYLSMASYVIDTALDSISAGRNYTKEDEDVLDEASGVLEAICEAGKGHISFDYNTDDPEFFGEARLVAIYRRLKEIQGTISSSQRDRKHQAIKSRIHRLLDRKFSYQFSQGDLDRVQELLNELRTWITNAHGLTEEHRQRILKRLEAAQAEIHKKVSDLDRLWGFIGDMGVVVGKFGKDAKPFVDRVRELTQIAWRTQSHAEELPSSTPPPQISFDE